ncbi:hypothetical protein P879_05408 [Paragonimus westermani]|uniref:Uncharacterized protein n=1 Tax=Paragonimus westermani TaxID=34504 RepID=A0A8T0DN44_9TREM|nr:hypothetical protein P879_05408 [Paragonimus westermani]
MASRHIMKPIYFLSCFEMPCRYGGFLEQPSDAITNAIVPFVRQGGNVNCMFQTHFNASHVEYLQFGRTLPTKWTAFRPRGVILWALTALHRHQRQMNCLRNCPPLSICGARHNFNQSYYRQLAPSSPGVGYTRGDRQEAMSNTRLDVWKSSKAP